MLSKLLTSALFAGAAAGLIAGLLQLVFVQPVLLHAELYEGGDLVHFGAASVSAHPELPGFDPVRDLLSIVFTMLTYTGYAMMLVALMLLAEERGAEVTARSGIIWGVAGFIAAHLAPGFSLAPELPGVAAADVGVRQIWWFATVISAGIAMWLLAFGRNWAMWGAAMILLAAPHVIGAPEPDQFAGPVPTELAALFASRAFGVGLAAWALLGCFSAYFLDKEQRR
ncbi:CbtA family protein [Sulfitobacter donghicola]|uniref:Cobalt transporter n=1 Tax=Sulfitobacter donghicola DSW-25 = KCTC 12864 = JCM 14565 TaxID=1300350 RepID=A0A073IYT6_9RHOB|nr:CbtA family protein [Sulfitobacter donghicola]KEJ90522.1 cobalt transporter [Sulfitobacter donghicola DSW-25 = KCTC 12864 = JCM 14565]KIN67764.1 putative cobalt transporter subunit CbtA [Sulfitobacter donghicola DSW-25 = KCTC 12864 = JCM 14565]